MGGIVSRENGPNLPHFGSNFRNQLFINLRVWGYCLKVFAYFRPARDQRKMMPLLLESDIPSRYRVCVYKRLYIFVRDGQLESRGRKPTRRNHVSGWKSEANEGWRNGCTGNYVCTYIAGKVGARPNRVRSVTGNGEMLCCL